MSTEGARWPPGALTFLRSGRGMRRVFLLLSVLLLSRPAFGFGAIVCDGAPGNIHCAAAANFLYSPAAVQAAQRKCEEAFLQPCPSIPRAFGHACVSVAVCPDDRVIYSEGSTKAEVISRARATLAGLRCRTNLFVCDGPEAAAYGFPTGGYTVAEPLDPTAAPFPRQVPALAQAPIAPAQSQPPAQSTPTSNQPHAGVEGAIAAIVEIDRNIWIGAIAFDALLFLNLLVALWKNDARLNILGLLTCGCVIVSIGLSFIPPSYFPYPAGNIFYYPIIGLRRAADIGFFAAGFPFLVLLGWYYFFDSTLPQTLPHASKHIEVLVARSQRRTWLRRVVFMIDARMGVSAEQFDLMKKYRLGRVLVYDSLRRQRQNELARAHLQMAQERKSWTICLWREEVRGLLRRIWHLIRALISFLIGFLFIRITISRLIRGAHIESKSLDRILQAKNAIETGAADLRAYLIAAESFDGREELFEPS